MPLTATVARGTGGAFDVPETGAPLCALVPVAEAAPGAGALLGVGFVAAFEAGLEAAPGAGFVAAFEVGFVAVLVAEFVAEFAAEFVAVLVAVFVAEFVAVLLAALLAGGVGAAGAVASDAVGASVGFGLPGAGALFGAAVSTGSGAPPRPNAKYKIAPRTSAAPTPIKIGLDVFFSPSSRGIEILLVKIRRAPFSKGSAACFERSTVEFVRIRFSTVLATSIGREFHTRMGANQTKNSCLFAPFSRTKFTVY